MALGGPPPTSQVVRNGVGGSGGAGPLVPGLPITSQVVGDGAGWSSSDKSSGPDWRWWFRWCWSARAWSSYNSQVVGDGAGWSSWRRSVSLVPTVVPASCDSLPHGGQL